MEAQEKNMLDMAAQFVNSTASHIFLTGKAGTGKTTFLRDLANSTHKKFAIVAPTGIAALNAGGTTIHSLFQIPPGTYLPDRTPSGDFSDNSSVFTEFTLGKKHFISALKRQILREIDILIIDEVSMLRADLLDAIDYRLRSAKGNHKMSFGGTQVLLIGDLYQLPPVVKDHEWSFLRRYYHSMYFFEAKCLQNDGFVFIELDKIFRQSDQRFIDLLNNFRNNVPTREDIDELNSRFKPPGEIARERDVITITTHNYLADQLNRDALMNLSSPAFVYDAEITDEFPVNIFPLPERLELKVGAQVMFVKNDTTGNGRYYNGRLAVISVLEAEDIYVVMKDGGETLKLSRETWENKKYTINELTRELDDQVIGTFRQFPIKLAWAITVHKSQGLTFDKAILDVGSAFASGQVYVALSRLRSLDGLILRTRLDSNIVPSDPEIVKFSQKKELSTGLDKMLKENQVLFIQRQMTSAFDFAGVVRQLNYIEGESSSNSEFGGSDMKPILSRIQSEMLVEQQNTTKFRDQLLFLLHQGEHEKLLERLSAGSSYYKKMISHFLKSLLAQIEYIKQQKRQKGLLSDLAEADQVLMKKLEEIEKIGYVVEQILSGKTIERRDFVVAERLNILKDAKIEAATIVVSNPAAKKKKTNRNRGEKRQLSHEVTMELFNKGKNIREIADERCLAQSTVEGHLVENILSGHLDVKRVVTNDELTKISDVVSARKEGLSDEEYKLASEMYGYFKLKAVRAHLGRVNIDLLSDAGIV